MVVEPHGGSVSWCQSSTSWIVPDILNVFGAAGPERSQTPPGRAWLHPIGVTLSHEIVWNAVCSLQWGLIHGERQLSTHSYPGGCSRTATVWSLKFEWFGVQPAALGPTAVLGHLQRGTEERLDGQVPLRIELDRTELKPDPQRGEFS